MDTNGSLLQQQQQQQQDTGTQNFDGAAEETDNFNRWLHYQRITPENGLDAVPRADGAKEVAAKSAAGVVVAYGSYDFRDHVMGYLTRGIFCNHQAREVVPLLKGSADDTIVPFSSNVII